MTQVSGASASEQEAGGPGGPGTVPPDGADRTRSAASRGSRRRWVSGVLGLLALGAVAVPTAARCVVGRCPWSDAAQSAAVQVETQPRWDASLPGPRAGWRQVFVDEFSGAALDRSRWSAYSGEPGSDPGARWDPSRVAVRDGLLTLTTAQDDGTWTSGGINNARAVALTSGMYEVRLRSAPAPGVTLVGLLWPKDNEWPPEIDFVEDRDGDRAEFTASLHYEDRDGEHQQVNRALQLDMSAWHTYGVQWRPGEISYFVDGRLWARLARPEVPEVPMGLALQANAVTRGGGQAGPGTPRVSTAEVDWVAGYVPSG